MSIASSAGIARVPDDILYPAEDGEPMAETQLHIRAIILLLQALEDFLASQLEIYIAANMFWYWEEGNREARRAPDIMVIKGVGRRIRRSFLSWKEGGAIPSVVFEMASEGTWRENLTEKRQLYAELGIREYFIFDPEAKYLRPPLLGFRRTESGDFMPISPDDDGRHFCQELGCYFRRENDILRVIDAANGKPVQLRSELIEEERKRADKERKAARSEKRRADTEKARADALEREVARLKAALEKDRGAGPTKRKN